MSIRQECIKNFLPSLFADWSGLVGLGWTWGGRTSVFIGWISLPISSVFPSSELLELFSSDKQLLVLCFLHSSSRCCKISYINNTSKPFDEIIHPAFLREAIETTENSVRVYRTLFCRNSPIIFSMMALKLCLAARFVMFAATDDRLKQLSISYNTQTYTQIAAPRTSGGRKWRQAC